MARVKKVIRRRRVAEATPATNVAERFIELTKAKKKIEEELKELRKQILATGQETIPTPLGTIKVVTETKVELDVSKVYDLLDIETFLRIASVSVTKAREVLTPEELTGCTKATREVKKVMVKR